MLPSRINHFDWGVVPGKQWGAEAELGADGRYTAHAPLPAAPPQDLIPSIRSDVGSDRCALIGFDFPIGLPASYARLAKVPDFKTFLRGLGHGEWIDFYKVAQEPSEISVRRPFYPFAPGRARQAHLLSALGLVRIDDLRRDARKSSRGGGPPARSSGHLGPIKSARAPSSDGAT